MMSDTSHNEIPTRKVTFLDGSQVGIANLDKILNDVVGLELTDPKSIRQELLERVKACNYVPRRAENDYSTVLFHEYQKKTGVAKASPENQASHGPG